jgi:hypothetical protein
MRFTNAMRRPSGDGVGRIAPPGPPRIVVISPL